MLTAIVSILKVAGQKRWYTRILSSFLLLAVVFGNGFVLKTPAMQKPGDNLPLIVLIPDQMILSGDVATQTNSQGTCVESWFSGTLTGTVILGVKPGDCSPKNWNGGTATAQVFLPAPLSPTLYTLSITWSFTNGKGLHSPYRNRLATMTLDGHPLWGKRTTQLGMFSDYYGANNAAVQTTLVVTQSVTHTLTINVPANTAWDISRIDLQAQPYPTLIHGIGYSPYRDCQYPDGALQPTRKDIEEDLFRLSHTANAIRTYSATGINAQVPAVANALELPVFAGAWLDDIPNDPIEIQSLISLAKTYHLDAVIVGNEFFLRHRNQQALDNLKNYMLQVKNSIPPGIPITTAEIDSLMFDWSGADQLTPSINPAYRSILELEDIVLVHIYPFWNGMPIQGAANFTVQRYRAIQALMEREFPGQNKRVIIGEAGWPSGGGENIKAVPSLENQSRYLREFLNLANQYQVEFFYFDAFDELWKREGDGVGQHWGYSYTDRTAKHPFYGVLLQPQPDLVLPSSIFLPVTFNLSSPITAPPPGNKLVDVVYKDWPEAVDGFVASGFMGDIHNIQLDECYRADAAEGEMSVHATFTPTGTLGWGGVYWQYPDGNWGDNAKGIDLSAANKITFRARGAKGGERIKFFAGGIGDATTPYHDSLRPEVSTGFILLSSAWQTYTINLHNQDLSHMIGGFGWSTDKCANPNGAEFFLDNILYEYDPDLPPPPGPGPLFPVYTDAAAPDNHYTPAGWMGNTDQINLNECWQENPHSVNTSIRNDYFGVSGWGGVYWLFPANNLGDRPGGYDLTGAKRLTFWARSDTPNASVKFLIGGVGYPNGTDCSSRNNPFPDSACPKIETKITLGPSWTKYTIALPQGRDLHLLVGGFGWVAESPVTFYLDDIIYEFQ